MLNGLLATMVLPVGVDASVLLEDVAYYSLLCIRVLMCLHSPVWLISLLFAFIVNKFPSTQCRRRDQKACDGRGQKVS